MNASMISASMFSYKTALNFVDIGHASSWIHCCRMLLLVVPRKLLWEPRRLSTTSCCDLAAQIVSTKFTTFVNLHPFAFHHAAHWSFFVVKAFGWRPFWLLQPSRQWRVWASWSGEFLVGDLHPEAVHQDGLNWHDPLSSQKKMAFCLGISESHDTIMTQNWLLFSYLGMWS